MKVVAQLLWLPASDSVPVLLEHSFSDGLYSPWLLVYLFCFLPCHSGLLLQYPLKVSKRRRIKRTFVSLDIVLVLFSPNEINSKEKYCFRPQNMKKKVF